MFSFSRQYLQFDLQVYIFSVSSRICTQIPGEWQARGSDAEKALLPLVHSIVVYCLEHSAESEAVDLLMEIDHVPLLKDLVREDTYQRVCLYLTRHAGDL